MNKDKLDNHMPQTSLDEKLVPVGVIEDETPTLISILEKDFLIEQENEERIKSLKNLINTLKKLRAELIDLELPETTDPISNKVALNNHKYSIAKFQHFLDKIVDTTIKRNVDLDENEIEEKMNAIRQMSDEELRKYVEEAIMNQTSPILEV